MTGIASTGIGSGLDVTGIVQQLVAAEGAPVQGQLARREAAAQSKLSAFGSLKSALSDLQSKSESIKTIDSILARKASSGEEEAFTVTAESSASPASYSFEVVRLASAQKLTSGVFTDADTIVGTGTLTIDIGGESMDLLIEAGGETLSNIRDAINSAEDNPGVSATIVNADAGSYLILTGEKTGLNNDITITQTGGDGGLAALEYPPGGPGLMEEVDPALDALIRIDGLDVQNDTNTFTDAIEGVTIDLLAATTSVTTLSVENDNSAITARINRFVTSYNNLIDLNASLTSYDEDSNIAGALIGDATLRGVVAQIRKEMNTAVTDINGPFSLLNDIGIELQVDGKFEVDQTKLEEALDSDFVRVGQLFSNSDGFAVRVFDAAESFLDTDGILETRTDGLNGQIDLINEQRETLNSRLTSLEARLFRQYNALDSLLSDLNNTSNFLNAQLQNLPGFTKPSS